MSDTPKPPVLDAFGLEKIPLHASKDEATDRDFSRAPITSGGTITGKAFQTDSVDPRIVLDSTQLVAHKVGGTQTIKIDVATGVVSVLSAGAASGGMQFVDAAGAPVARIVDDPTLLFAGLLLQSIASLTLLADTTLSGSPPAEYMSIVMETGAVSPGIFIEGRDATQAHAGSVQIPAPSGAASHVVIENNDAATEFVSFIGGNILLSQSGVEKDVMCALPAFTTVVGVRWTAAGAGSVGGQFDHYRQVRGSMAGARVTPAGAVYTPATAVNVAAATIITILDVGAFFAVSATAAGNVVAVGSVVYS